MRKKMVQHKSLKFKALYFVEGYATFRGYKYRPDETLSDLRGDGHPQVRLPIGQRHLLPPIGGPAGQEVAHD
jgi:hypothetical protein